MYRRCAIWALVSCSPSASSTSASRAEIVSGPSVLIGPLSPLGRAACVVLENFDQTPRPVDANALSISDALGGALDTDDRDEPVLARDDGSVGHQATNLGDETRDGDKQRRPTRIGVGRDKDVAGL